MPTEHQLRPPRHHRLAGIAGALLIGLTGIGSGFALSAAPAAPLCGPDGEILRMPGAPVSCTHSDVPPPGVDVTEPVSTSELKDREGASETAYDAAQELGVPASYAAGASSPLVKCDGDGTSGYRVQAMYVVEQSKANRYGALLDSFRLWAAGVDDVVNRSAALTDGVRNVRYVTESTAGGCVAKVLNVTVPDGSMSSFGATINAVQALGYTRVDRKYMMWTDATTLCGIAQTYPQDTDGQGNNNNGYYTQFARIDSGCWGWGDGANQHSVEAHELLHTFGSVMPTAPHATSKGHCYDESDTLCYADGGGKTMQQICDPAREYLLDCNSDDYFSTYPDPGSWLDLHWNTADSRFLIGGGDGTGGGSAGAPTVLGGTLSVNNPAVPGLPTQTEVSPTLPSGREITKVAWKAGRSDCTFSSPTELATNVTCGAASASATSVTVTLTDSTGATKTITSPLTFSNVGARSVVLDLGIDGQDRLGGDASVCTSTAFPVVPVVRDALTGVPVKGIAVVASKQTDGSTTVASLGTKSTDSAGTAALTTSVTAPTTVSVKTNAAGAWQAASPLTMRAVPTTCSFEVSAQASASTVYYGDPVTVSGTVTRQLDARTLPVGGVSVAVKLIKEGGTTVTLGTVKTAADGTYRGVFKPTVSGDLVVSLTGTAHSFSVSGGLPRLWVRMPETELHAVADRFDVGYGDVVTVNASLRRWTEYGTTPLASATVSLTVTAPGKTPVSVGSGRTLADGTLAAKATMRVSGVLKAVYAGTAGQPAATVTLGEITVGTWTTDLMASSSAYQVLPGGSVILSGTLRKSYGVTTAGAAAQRVKVYATPDGGLPVLVTTVTTTSTGTWSARVYPKATGTLHAVFAAAPGYLGSESNRVPITVG